MELERLCKMQENVINFKKTSEKNLVGGLVTTVVCPVLKVYFTTKIGKKTNISLFTIPKREDLRKKLLNVLKHVRRKKGADSLYVKNPNKRIYVCEFHSKDEDLTTTLSRGEKKVRAGRIPSIFREQPVKTKATRPLPKN